MASIGEARAGVALANEKASDSMGALAQAQASLEQAQGALERAGDGSGQPDVPEARALLAQAVSAVLDLQQTVAAAMQATEGVEYRL